MIDFCAETTSMLRNIIFRTGRILKARINDFRYQLAVGVWHRPAVYLCYALNGNRVGVDTWVLIGLVAAGGQLNSSQAVAAEVVRHFNIGGQSLNNALIQFAAQAELELIFSADLLRELASPELRGDMSAEQALTHLLHGSGFTYRFIDTDTVTLERSPEATELSNLPPPVTLDAMTVVGLKTGEAGAEIATERMLDEARTYAVSHIASATGTDTPIKQIPQSVHALKRPLLDDQQTINLSESLLNVSGVVPRNVLYSPVIEGTLIRGFRSEQLIDGFTQYYNPGDRESTINIDRIEVLKGSNALLYSGGSGSPVGGVVNLLSKLPQAKAFGEAGFRIGSHSFYQPFFDVNQPLNANILLRMTGEYTNARHDIDIIETQRFNLNPALTLTDNEQTRLTIQAKLSRWQQPEYQGLPATGSIAGDFATRPDLFVGPDNLPDSHSDADALWATLDRQLTGSWRVNLKARYAQAKFDEKIQTLFGSDGLIADRPLLPASNWALVNAELFQQQHERSVLGNLQGKFKLGPSENNLLLGADYSRLQDAGFIEGNFGALGLGVGTVDLRAPLFATPYDVPGPGQENQFIENITYGAYLQWQSTLYRRLHWLSGLRLGKVGIDFNNAQTGIHAKTDTLKWLPRLGGVIDLNDEVSWFVSYSEGMRGQPFVNFVDTPAPELSNHLETGLKFKVSNQFSGQLALYQIERSQVAVTDSSDFLRRSVAAGRQRSRGVEMDLLWQPVEGFSVLANYAHTDARFMDDKAGVAAGNRLAQVPEDAGRLWAHYRFQQDALQGFSVGFGVYARAGAYLSNNNRFKTAGYHSFDAALAYETGRFKWAATVKNLSDEDYFQPYGYFEGRVAPAAGRAGFLSFSIKY
ncbi:TonB-dependent siderophore receptor [Methylomonas fluvii]|nr:TonB-dependent siderophore receptor [Methylomonas fluvii]